MASSPAYKKYIPDLPVLVREAVIREWLQPLERRVVEVAIVGSFGSENHYKVDQLGRSDIDVFAVVEDWDLPIGYSGIESMVDLYKSGLGMHGRFEVEQTEWESLAEAWRQLPTDAKQAMKECNRHWLYAEGKLRKWDVHIGNREQAVEYEPWVSVWAGEDRDEETSQLDNLYTTTELERMLR